MLFIHLFSASLIYVLIFQWLLIDINKPKLCCIVTARRFNMSLKAVLMSFPFWPKLHNF